MEDERATDLDEEDEEDELDPDTLGFKRLYSHIELAPHAYKFCTMLNCSGIHPPSEVLPSPGDLVGKHLICDICRPSDR